ncbi:hypothetical protein C1645_835286 [Glomus cerebriforme]|uniref:Uncharacterized protein n=1 Tax=Glomus cerebriforme TaxID=658196 RepID=A0A397SCQ2_9GLOM|nr:hypothetical protein C1645_835286 [Glomus cerebriforme]
MLIFIIIYKVLNSISSNSNSAITNNNTNDKDKDETTTQDETITSTEATSPRASLSSLNLNTKHSISIWNMNRLTHNRPAKVDSNTEYIAKEITTLLNKLNNCEELAVQVELDKKSINFNSEDKHVRYFAHVMNLAAQQVLITLKAIKASPQQQEKFLAQCKATDISN